MKLTEIELRKYSSEFSEKASNNLFTNRDFILGNEVLSLFETEQLNLNLIRILFQRWNQQIVHLDSPFFDFKSEEVIEALNKFMIVLSRNIKINKIGFDEILEVATYETLKSHFYPKEFIFGVFNNYESKIIDSKWLKTNKSYLKDFDFIFTEIERKSDFEKGIPKFEALSIIENTNEALFSNIELNLEEFNSIVPFEKSVEEKSFFDLAKEKKPEKVIFNPPIDKSLENKILEKGNVSNNQIPKENLEFNSINDKNSSPKNLFKISNLKEAISLNQRFLFINNLFNGDFNSFNDALEHIEKLKSANEALLYLEQKFANFSNNVESIEKDEFIDLLNRRF